MLIQLQSQHLAILELEMEFLAIDGCIALMIIESPSGYNFTLSFIYATPLLLPSISLAKITQL